MNGIGGIDRIGILEITMCNVMKIKMHCISNNGKKRTRKEKKYRHLGFLEILLDESEVPSWGPPELLAAPLLDIFTHTRTNPDTTLFFMG